MASFVCLFFVVVFFFSYHVLKSVIHSCGDAEFLCTYLIRIKFRICNFCPDASFSSQNVFFFCVRCDDLAKSSGRWLLGSPPSTVARQLIHGASCPLLCLLAKTVGVLSPGVGRSEECAQEFAPQSHIHSGLNQQDPISSDVFLAHSDQYADLILAQRFSL